MKTIIIPVFQGVVALNILRTDVLKGLRQGKNVRIVLLMPNQLRIDYYRSFFPESDDLKYATFPALRERLAGTFFFYLKVFLLRTGAVGLKRRYSYYESRNALRSVAGSG